MSSYIGHQAVRLWRVHSLPPSLTDMVRPQNRSSRSLVTAWSRDESTDRPKEHRLVSTECMCSTSVAAAGGDYISCICQCSEPCIIKYSGGIFCFQAEKTESTGQIWRWWFWWRCLHDSHSIYIFKLEANSWKPCYTHIQHIQHFFMKTDGSV